jgi:peroxiredoxin Q/BCP
MSGDTVEELAKFRDKYELNLHMAGDTELKTLEAYGVWQEKNMYGVKKMGIARTTYLIDPAGKVTYVFPKVQVNGHAQEVLKALKS